MLSRCQHSKALHSAAQSVTARSFSTSPIIQSASTTQLLEDLTKRSSLHRTPSSTQTSRGNFPTENADRFMEQITSQQRTMRQSGALDAQQVSAETTRLQEMSRTMKRRWKTGDVYAPHDLSAEEARKWSKGIAPTVDIFDRLAINPLNEWKLLENPAMMFEFQSTHGKILSRENTGLRPVNQRRIARAVRRAIGMGFLPSVYAHPELLRRTNRGVGI